jgi:hypothetical protein
MTKTNWTDKDSGFYTPFEEKSWLWNNCPYLIFLLVNCLYIPIFLALGSIVLVVLALGLSIGGGGYLVYRFLGKTLWISLKYKDSEAKSRIKKLWSLNPPKDTSNKDKLPDDSCYSGDELDWRP